MANTKTGCRRPRPGPQLSAHQIVLRPLVTEKGMHRSTRYNQYAFEVNPLSDKETIKEAIEELFNVKVEKVRTQSRKGKPRRYRFRYGHDQELEESDRDFGQGRSDRVLLIRIACWT